MASCDLKKYTKAQMRGLSRHYENSLRKNLNHSNEDIDKSATDKNYFIGCSSYEEALQRMDERVAAVDSVQPPIRRKADRITALSINIPCPKEVERAGKSDDFFKGAYSVMEQLLGAENVVGAAVHKDEIHEYMDHGNMRESMEHMNVFAVPYTPEKGINAKARCTREFLHDLSEGVHQMCLREFGVQYKTGEFARKKSVEQLKAASYRELLKETENLLKRAKFTTQQLEEQIAAGNHTLEDVTAKIQTKEQELRELAARQTETAVCAVNELIEPLKKRAGEHKKAFSKKVVIEDASAYETIKQLQQDIISYVTRLEKFSAELPRKQRELEEQDIALCRKIETYEHAIEKQDQLINEKAYSLAGEYNKDYATRLFEAIQSLVATMSAQLPKRVVDELKNEFPMLEEILEAGNERSRS